MQDGGRGPGGGGTGGERERGGRGGEGRGGGGVREKLKGGERVYRSILYLHLQAGSERSIEQAMYGKERNSNSPISEETNAGKFVNASIIVENESYGTGTEKTKKRLTL